MKMELPECHDAAIEKADALGGLFRDKLAIYLSALKEQGLLRETILYPVENIHWVTNTSWVGLYGRDGDTRALIIRMEQK